jgi:hypothetical protein
MELVDSVRRGIKIVKLLKCFILQYFATSSLRLLRNVFKHLTPTKVTAYSRRFPLLYKTFIRLGAVFLASLCNIFEGHSSGIWGTGCVHVKGNG